MSVPLRSNRLATIERKVARMSEEKTGIAALLLPTWTEALLVQLMHIQSTPEVQIMFLKRLRDARLAEVDAIERLLNMQPRTAEIRAEWRNKKAPLS